MTQAPVSLIIVSRHRAEALRRCLTAIAQLDHPNFEVIVVADPEALRGLPAKIKTAAFDTPNISAARNLGIDLAAGEIAAFIDDDAVPEPTWLSRLTEPFADPEVAAATGFVRGRNGISLQWRAAAVDQTGRDVALDVPATEVSLHRNGAALAIKTQGTNAAFRLSELRGIGGFDPSYAFYFDDADVNRRLARGLTAIVPMAQVHHGFAASARRAADRTPRSLFDIGASSAVFLRRHAPAGEIEPALDALRQAQRQRLIGFLQRGPLEPRDIARLMRTLESGIAEGKARKLDPLVPRAANPPAFLPFPGPGPRPGLILAGRPWSRKRLRREAAAASGAVVTVFRFSPTGLPHRMRFDPAGFWEQTGGLFGRSDRDGPRLRPSGFQQRLRREIARIAPFRPTGDTPPSAD